MVQYEILKSRVNCANVYMFGKMFESIGMFVCLAVDAVMLVSIHGPHNRTTDFNVRREIHRFVVSWPLIPTF